MWKRSTHWWHSWRNTTQHIFVALWDTAMTCERGTRIPAGQDCMPLIAATHGIHNVSAPDNSHAHDSAIAFACRHIEQNPTILLRTPALRSSACPPLHCIPYSCAEGTCVSRRTSVVDPRHDSNIRSSNQRSPSGSYLAVLETPPGCHGDSNGRSSRRRDRPTSSRTVALERRSESPTRWRRTTKRRSWSRIGPGTHDKVRQRRSALINRLSRLQICVNSK